jgi:DNA-binding transcriptional MerR regulator
MAGKADYPKKLYYSISEVAEIIGVKAHVLRYWESEFPTLRPKKTRSGSRRYRERDIEELQIIRSLLYDQGFKIAGARKALRDQRVAPAEETVAPAQMALGFDAMSDAQKLAFVRDELQAVLALVRELPQARSAAGRSGKLKEMKGKG